MGIYDILLFPVYLLFFYFFFSSRRKKINDPVLKIYHKRGFWIKAMMVLPFAYFNFKLSPGDSYVLYHVEGANIYHLILKSLSNIKWLTGSGEDYNVSGLLADTWNLGYCRDPNNYMIVKIVTVISFFTFGKYLITCLFFSMIPTSNEIPKRTLTKVFLTRLTFLSSRNSTRKGA